MTHKADKDPIPPSPIRPVIDVLRGISSESIVKTNYNSPSTRDAVKVADYKIHGSGEFSDRFYEGIAHLIRETNGNPFYPNKTAPFRFNPESPLMGCDLYKAVCHMGADPTLPQSPQTIQDFFYALDLLEIEYDEAIYDSNMTIDSRLNLRQRLDRLVNGPDELAINGALVATALRLAFLTGMMNNHELSSTKEFRNLLDYSIGKAMVKLNIMEGSLPLHQRLNPNSEGLRTRDPFHYRIVLLRQFTGNFEAILKKLAV